jgi:hypothetical protein
VLEGLHLAVLLLVVRMVLLLVVRMVLLVGPFLVGFPLVDLLLLRICTSLVRAFFRLVVLSTRMVREWYGPFHSYLVDLVGQVLLPGIVLRRQRPHDP